MIDLLRKRFGKEYLVFVIDEAGQYVGSQTDLILICKDWPQTSKMATQQTLMEDSAAAALNSPELFETLIAINLLANEVREIVEVAESPADLFRCMARGFNTTQS